jgi:hypothetical protein
LLSAPGRNQLVDVSEVVNAPGNDLLERSALYREFLAEREEILRHKWLESEKAGRDIGFEAALVSWVMHHRARWRKERRQGLDLSQSESPELKK